MARTHAGLFESLRRPAPVDGDTPEMEDAGPQLGVVDE
jgi:hypothetical protein